MKSYVSEKRRNFLKGLGAISVITPFIGQSTTAVPMQKMSNDRKLRVGIIGFGFRGEQLARAMKFAHPDWIREQKEAQIKDSRHKVWEDFNSQEELPVTITGICDVYEKRMARGLAAVGGDCRGYKDYRELINQEDIEAVIIATPDHWHAKMAMDAARAGKHVYLEKCMTRTPEEAVTLRKVIKNEGIVFQLGHQGRQNDLQKRARDLYQKGILGKVTLVETTTNRNNLFGAWIWPIDEDASPENIDWEKFCGPDYPSVTFNAEHFFRWRCWWSYGTGMAGDLFTHDYDAVNQVMGLGIPDSANASGGIYFYKDGREVPDVFNASFEYKNQELTLLYNGTLANGVTRGTMIMGHDASLELGQSLTIWADSQSSKYRSRIETGIIDPASPLVRFRPQEFEADAITSATSKYFADRGLMYTYLGGKRVDTTNLHLAEWLHAINTAGETSCGIEQGFQEAITAHMATTAFRSGRQVYWDTEKQKII